MKWLRYQAEGTMSSPTSNSEDQTSASYYSLHPDVQRWVYEKGWGTLKEIQERAIPSILSAKQDVILAAPTASGKTEAAFLPICSSIAKDRQASVEALYISPLKALINDQFARLENLCESVNIQVCKWHGDASENLKRKLLSQPRGLLLITPESLEAMYVLKGPAVKKLFQHVKYVVIDEVHCFIGTERGRQLQSQLHRLELALRRRVPRVALSATLGDMQRAAEFLRPGFAKDVEVLVSRESGQEIQIQVRGYLKHSLLNGPGHSDAETGDERAIAEHLFSVLRGTNNLIFCNARQSVEKYADLLRRTSFAKNVPNEFYPHHGNLSKELREDLERRLKVGEVPVTGVATTTLELGIDIGAVKSIAQIGPPFSVSSIRQRLGRSGRRGEAAILRCYIQEAELTKTSSIIDSLRLNLFQTVAMVNLLVAKWNEPPIDRALHLSTLIQQVLSLIAQYGGIKPKELYSALCSCGPFAKIEIKVFADLLHALGTHDLISQSHDSTLTLGLNGERLVNNYDFYTAFTTPEEYRIVNESKDLGTIPIEHPVIPGQFLIFAGKRWEVLSVDGTKKLIQVRQADAGRLPTFGGTPGTIHGAIRKEMYRLYQCNEVPPFMNPEAVTLFGEGRDNFKRLGLYKESMLSDGTDTLMFLWEGDSVVHTVSTLLVQKGVRANVSHGIVTASDVDPTGLKKSLELLASEKHVDAIQLAHSVPNKLHEKHDWYLSEDLLDREFASRALDIDGALLALSRWQ
jgi:ATP-dependent helicase Lhr and Lhr-like helicase